MLRMIAAGWDYFFHRQANLSIFGPIRIAYSILLLINILCWWPDLETWFGPEGVVTMETLRASIDPDTITLFQWLPQEPWVLWTCYLALIASAVGLLLGLFTRFQLVCVFVLYTSFAHRNHLLFDGEDILFRLMAFYMFFSPAGKYLSVDRWWEVRTNPQRVESPTTYAIWPLRLFQIQTVAVLLFSGIEKLQGEAWRDGTALYYVSRLDDFFCRFPLPEFVFESLMIMTLLTWATLVIEILIPIFVWPRRTRPIALFIMLLFHLSLDYSMNLNLFHWMMLVGWMSFIEPLDVTAFRGWFRRGSRDSVAVSNP